MTLLLAVLLAAQGQGEFETRCANCHFIPDTGLRADRLWLDQIKTTA